jgi:hypothetical protein
MTYQILRHDEKFIKLNGRRKAFFKGGNSTCRLHIRQHYELYKERCEKENIPLHHWAIPRPIWKEEQEEKEAEERGQLTKKQQQQMLNFKTVTGPREFTREGVLHAVTVLIATNYQVRFQYTIKNHLTHRYSPIASITC